MPRQWDDWRCYRCNRWRPAAEKRTPHTTPAGIVVSVCERCAAEKAAEKGPA